MYLSVIMPTYNEASKIIYDLDLLACFLSDSKFDAEIIITDDGSSDDTVALVKSFQCPSDIVLHVIANKPNKGKGHAVQQGVQYATGQYIMFCDAGSCTPYSMIARGLTLLEQPHCDIAHGSRKLAESIITHQPSWYRQILSKLFLNTVKRFMHLPRHLTDTQCGFKMYTQQAAKALYPLLNTNGFTYDIEIILRAKHANFTIKEFPIEWASDSDSRVKPLRMLIQTITSLIQIKRNVDATIKNMAHR